MKNLFYLAALVLLASCTAAPRDISNLPSHYISFADSVSVHYKTWGNGPQDIVFVHGFGCDMNAWEAQYDAFKKNKDYRLVFIDLPGYGQSSKPHTDYTLDFFDDGIEAVLNEIGANYSVLVGHSLGTPVCRNLLLRNPMKISGMMDIDGVYCLYPTLGDNPSEEELAAAQGYEEAVLGFAASFDGDSCHDNIVGFVQSLAGPDTPQAILDYAMSTMPLTPEYVASSTMHNLIDRKWWPQFPIPFPVEIICTQNSGLEPDNQQQMLQLYPEAGYTELVTCGHFIQMEQPELVNEALIRLCKNTIKQNLEDYDYGVAQIEDNYAGFKYKITDENRAEYEALIKGDRERIAKGQMYAADALTDLCYFFQDYHLTSTLRGNSERFPMTWPDYRSKMKEYNPQPVAEKIDNDHFLIRFPTCMGDDAYVAWVYEAADSFRKSGCSQLVLDIRGNGGGYDYQYDPLIFLLYSQAAQTDGVMMKNTKDNRDRTREMVRGDEFWTSLMDMAEERADSAYVTLFSSVEYVREVDPARPKKTAVIIDKGVGSSGEQLLLDLRAVAPDIKFYGRDNTLGSIDISNVRTAPLLHAPNSLNIPVTISARVIEGRGLIDGIGIAPDVRMDLELPETLTDNIDSWVLWVAEHM